MDNIVRRYFDECDGIVILAGAGMGVDAGIPDFRGRDGLWNQEKGRFMKYTDAIIWKTEPLNTWNFYIERFLNYRDTPPHDGYGQLLSLQDRGHDMFVVTSNVDGHFKRAGFDPDRIYEIHGNLEWIQCSDFCCRDVRPMPQFTKLLATDDEMPRCDECGKPMRPMVMMFNDPWFYPKYTGLQSIKYVNWSMNKTNLLGIELGAGTHVPSIRHFGRERTARLIRINLYEHSISREQDISIPETALQGINTVFKLLEE